MKKIGWNFPSNDNGCVNGVSEAGIETFKGDVFKSLAKEICQNSLDARLDDDKPVRIEFYLSNIDIEDIPDFERLQEVFVLSKNYWEDNKKANNFYENALKIIKSKKIRLLRISDFNTTGITGAREEKSSNWIDLVKSSGVSNKTGTAGGSYGIGKNAPFASSDLRIVYYSTFDKDNIRAYQGVAKLASFEEEKLSKDTIWDSFSKKKKKVMTQGMGFYGNIENNLPIYNVETKENNVSLTINCAWNADDIDSILKTLEKENVKATFFMVGDWVDKFPEVVKKISEAGHEIGSHSNTHPHVTNLSYEENIKEIEESTKKIENITKKKVNIYRAPYGEYNDTVIKAANDKNLKTIQWNLDTLDYTGLSGEEMWDRLKDKIKNGDIILMHNGTKNTANSLEMIIKNIKQKELNIVPISSLIYQDNYIINSNGTQISK